MPSTSSQISSNPQAAFVLRLGKALHSHGAPAHRLEQAVEQVAERMGLRIELFSLPTSLFAKVTVDGQETTHLQRVYPSEVNLERLLALDALADEVASGACSAEEGSKRIEDIDARPPTYGPMLRALGVALVAFGSARFFGGGGLECLLALLIGLVVAVISTFRAPIAPLLAAAAASFGATVAATATGGALISTFVVTMASVLVLLPGLSLTIAMNELATGHIMSGTGRLVSALVVFLELGFGVLIGQELAASLPLGTFSLTGIPLPPWTWLLAMVVVTGGLIILLQAPVSGAPIVFVGVVVALVGARSAALAHGPEIGAAIAAFSVGMLANLYSRTRHRPVTLMLIPAVLVLVPGSIGFRGFSAMFEELNPASIETAVSMFLIATAIVVGLLAANSVVSPRRAL